ncbi:MAG: CBU_2076 family Dot/Icm type IV secretion system effector [Gammaproteobacteria bacterium]
MYKIAFYVTAEHLEELKTALFTAGAGHIGNYDHCCWQTKGTGQFRPLAESNPYLGEPEQLSRISEYLVEMVCRDEYIREVVEVLKAQHPYENPAYQVWKIEDF